MTSLRWNPPAPGNLQNRLNDKLVVGAFLQRLGFIQKNASLQSVDLSSSLKALQRVGGLPQTGSLDAATVELMKTPCCGFVAEEEGTPAASTDSAGLPAAFTLMGTKWDHTRITYRFDQFTADLAQSAARTAIVGAFEKWTGVVPLTFVEVTGSQAADIRIAFVTGNHGDNSPFDGPGNVLAHAYGPGNGPDNVAGDVHFDDAESWSNADFLAKVALHEIGHAIGLGHSTIGSAVMYPFFNNQGVLQPDDTAGAQSLYGAPERWTTFVIDAAGNTAVGTDFAAVSRKKETMEIWWIAGNGSVQNAYWYEGSAWRRQEITPAGAAAAGGIVAVARMPNTLEIWWIGPTGSVENAYWYEGQQGWRRQQIAPPGSAAPGTKVTALSRKKETMEVWWIAPNGSVQDAYWYEGQTAWNRFELSPPGSATVGGIKAVSRISTSMELWWVAPNGAIKDAYWYEGQQGWRQFELAAAGSAAVGTNIAATTRIPTSMEIWWVAPNGAVKDAYWYEGQQGWRQFELAPAGSAAKGGIEAVSRIPDSMEVWWTGPDGSVQDAYWYATSSEQGWRRFAVQGPGSARPGSDIAVTARIPNSMEIWYSGSQGGVVDSFVYL
jgi:hypothetical protein